MYEKLTFETEFIIERVLHYFYHVIFGSWISFKIGKVNFLFKNDYFQNQRVYLLRILVLICDARKVSTFANLKFDELFFLWWFIPKNFTIFQTIKTNKFFKILSRIQIINLSLVLGIPISFTLFWLVSFLGNCIFASSLLLKSLNCDITP